MSEGLDAYGERRDKEISQMVFGFATPQAIYKWIHGTSMPTIDNLVILAAMLGVTLDEIVATEIIETVARKCG